MKSLQRANSRSSSTPAWFKQKLAQDDDIRGVSSARRDSNGYSANSRGPTKRGKSEKATPSPSPSNPRYPKQANRDGSGEHSVPESASRTPIMSTTDPDCEIDLPEDEDFVEGGVELSPPKMSAEDLLDRLQPATRPLAQLEERQLEDFWPSSDGLKALFLDYDGTLREFEAKPELAVPTEELRNLLSAINARQDFVPHIISGRNASFLEAHFGGYSRFTLVAEHGFQIWRPETKSWAFWDGTTDHELWKSAIRSEMATFVNEMPGSHLEEKASCLVWHYREVSNQTKAEDKAITVIARLAKLVEEGNLTDVRISHGHKIVEASYQKVRKGPVMRKLCEEKALFGEPFIGVLTAGDDVSDESMFDAAASDYLTIKVGAAKTSARCRVDGPADLREFLWKLVRRGTGVQAISSSPPA